MLPELHSKKIQKEELQVAIRIPAILSENICMCTPASNATSVPKLKEATKIPDKMNTFEDMHGHNPHLPCH